MSKWFESKNIANYAKTALMQAQKRIDQVLDIKEDEILGTNVTHSKLNQNAQTLSSDSIKSESKLDGNESDSFFSSFLNQINTNTTPSKPSSKNESNPNTRSSSPTNEDTSLFNLNYSKKSKPNKTQSESSSSSRLTLQNDDLVNIDDKTIKFENFLNTTEQENRTLNNPSFFSESSPTSSLMERSSVTPTVSVIENETNLEINELELEQQKNNKLNNDRSLTPTNSNTSLTKSGSTKSIKQISQQQKHQSSQLELEKIEKQNWIQNYVDSNGGNDSPLHSNLNQEKSNQVAENLGYVNLNQIETKDSSENAHKDELMVSINSSTNLIDTIKTKEIVEILTKDEGEETLKIDQESTDSCTIEQASKENPDKNNTIETETIPNISSSSENSIENLDEDKEKSTNMTNIVQQTNSSTATIVSKTAEATVSNSDITQPSPNTNSIIEIAMDFVKIDTACSLSGNASSNEEQETCASSDIEVLSLPSNSGDQLLAISNNNNNKSSFLMQSMSSSMKVNSSNSSSTIFLNDSKVTSKLDTVKKNDSNLDTNTENSHSQIQAHSNKTHSQLIPNSNVMQIFVKSPPASQQLESHNNKSEDNSIHSNQSSFKSVLEAREAQILKLNKQNVKLQEDNDNLTNELEKLKYETNERFKLIQKNQNDLTSKYEQSNSDKENFKKLFNDMQRELAELKIQSKEKDQQIEQLTQEGLKLSKQELNQSNIIKKLRNKEKENEELLNILKNDYQKSQKELEELKKILDLKEEAEKQNIDSFKKLEKAAMTLEKEFSNTKSALEDSEEKVKSLENTLQNAFKELTELHRANAAKESKINEANSSIENQLKEEIQLAVEKERIMASKMQDALKWELQNVRADNSRIEQQHALREEMLRKEISDLQKQLRDTETRNNELSQNISTATRPLLRQIENLQSTHSNQIELLENAERNLIERLKESQASVCELSEKNRYNQETIMENSQKLKTHEAQIQTLKAEKSKLNAEYQLTKTNLETYENEKFENEAQNRVLIGSLNQQIEKLSKEKKYLETQLDMEKVKTENDAKKFQTLLSEFTKEREIQQQQLKQQIQSNLNANKDASQTSQNSHDQLKRLNSSSLLDTNRNDFIYSLQGTGAINILESLQSKLKQKEGEIVHLQKEIKNLEQVRESMAKELVNQSNKLDNLNEKLCDYPQLQEKFHKLNTEYNALLQMYGEKSEETEELKLDLQDVKEMYKLQIEDLIKRSNFS